MVVRLLEHLTIFTLSHVKIEEIKNLNNMMGVIGSMEGYIPLDVLTDYIPDIREIIQANLLKIDFFKYEKLPLYLTIEAA